MTQEEFFKRYKYDVTEDRIGGGGFGTVYKAYDNTLHREVAIKVSEVKVANGKTFSLKDEVEALAHVPEHPNIANYEKDKLFTFKTPQGVFDYAVMQYYPDGNLNNAIKQGMTPEQKEDVATQLLEGIAFLHEHKVVHRDLKPGNILIVRNGDHVIPLITDFGLSKAANTGDGSVFTNSIGGGTPRYSSPEQLQGCPLRFNTDLWSYGSILYEIFTGEQLFTAGSGAANTAQADMEIYNKIVNGDVSSLKGMPEKWRRVAERCLVVDAEKRAKDAAELFRIISGEEQADETVAAAVGQTVNGNDETKADAERVTPIGRTPNDKPSTTSRHRGPSFRENGTRSPKPNETTAPKPKSKKALWIALATAAVAAIAAILFLRQPKQEPVPLDTETEEFLACQTVADYRAYCANYGLNAVYYAEAQRKIDSIVNDSLQNAAAEALAAAIIDEASAYQQCTTIAGCRAYLKKYPNGTHASQVRETLTGLEDDEAYAACTTLAACDAYLRKYPQGRHVADVRKKREEFAAQAQQQGSSNGGENNVQPAPTPATPAPQQHSNPSNTLPNTPDSPQPAPQPTPQPAPEPTAPSFTGSTNGHEWVDLGLPSGTLWATCNIGASTPEGYGNYYAWGETTTKSTYNLDTYKYANGDYNTLTKYCNKSDYGDNGFTDNLTTLQGRDDPATSWGSGWHTPSKAQWDELLANTTNQWTTRNGVQGRLFTSKNNGQALFLPAAGYRWDSDLRYAGSNGYYWSRSLYTDYPNYAWGLYFNSGHCYMNDGYYRYSGPSVRPVR